MSGVDLLLELRKTKEELFQALSDLDMYSKEAPLKRRDYRREKAKRTAVKRAEGVPVSIIQTIVDGEDDIADLWCIAEQTENLKGVAAEKINILKQWFSFLREQTGREWSS